MAASTIPSASGGCGSPSERLAGLADAPRSGKPKTYDAAATGASWRCSTGRRPQAAPAGRRPCSASELGDVSDQHIWRFLRAQRIDLAGRRSWCLSTDPEFVAKAADIVGLYLDPPDNALVLAVDEKPAIQALERAQGYLKLPNGRALTGFAHEYGRRGTTTLFAALDVATGQIRAKHTKRRRRAEFLDFMNEVVADDPDREIHVILDNLSTHKPKRDAWLARHKNVHFHFTPTHASWLNQVEIWFSILARSTLCGRQLHLGRPAARGDRRLHRQLQPARRALPVAQGQSPSQGPRTSDHELMLDCTSIRRRGGRGDRPRRR